MSAPAYVTPLLYPRGNILNIEHGMNPWNVNCCDALMQQLTIFLDALKA
jgi:hypothetical protein